MTGQSATVIARWPLANPQSAIPLLGRALTVSRPGTSLGRRAVQIKPYRMPASHDKQGRNMYVVREHDGAHDNLAVLVEDPNAPLFAQLRDHANGGKGKGKATQDSDDDDDILFVDPGEDKKHTPDQHSRWTYCSIAQPLDAPGGDSASAASLFDSFIQRALFPPPQPGGAAAGGGANTSASSAANSRRDANGNANAQYWQPRAQVVSIEGFVFALTSTGGSGGNTAGVSPDWIVKVGSVGLKGGSASGMAKGCIIEASSSLFSPLLFANSIALHRAKQPSACKTDPPAFCHRTDETGDLPSGTVSPLWFDLCPRLCPVPLSGCGSPQRRDRARRAERDRLFRGGHARLARPGERGRRGRVGMAGEAYFLHVRGSWPLQSALGGGCSSCTPRFSDDSYVHQFKKEGIL